MARRSGLLASSFLALEQAEAVPDPYRPRSGVVAWIGQLPRGNYHNPSQDRVGMQALFQGTAQPFFNPRSVDGTYRLAVTPPVAQAHRCYILLPHQYQHGNFHALHTR